MISAAGTCIWAGDAQRGALVVGAQGCLECHTVGGQGVGHEPPLDAGAPDLTENLMPTYTPSALASALWNHTPEMWRKMAERDVRRPAATSAEWEDVFAYIYSLQFSERPAEVGRGKVAFESDGCSACHSIEAPARGTGKPVRAWTPLDDPVVLVYQMWRHASDMGTEFAGLKKPWPIMTGRDFMDLTAYLQYVQQRLPETRFSLPEAASGRLAFDEKCRQCHTGAMALENRSSNQTWLDLGAGMWNHAPLMKTVQNSLPAVPLEEMRRILAWVWEVQYQGPHGSQAAGQHVFEDAGCVNCHRSPVNGAPMSPRSREKFTLWSMVALGWGSARTMHQQMLDKGVAWPRLSPENMNDLVAYLNSLPGQ
jgi:cytochrome c2